MNNDEQYQAAVKTFLIEPEALTQNQLDALKGVDDRLGERAVTKRGEAQTKAAEARHRAALGQPPTKAKDADVMADNVLDVITLHLARPRSRIKALESANAALEQRCFDLESRLVGLEMRLVETHAHVER